MGGGEQGWGEWVRWGRIGLLLSKGGQQGLPSQGMLRGRERGAAGAAGRRGFQAGGTAAAEPLRQKGAQRSDR